MIRTLSVLALSGLFVLMVGCSPSKPQASGTNSSALDITPAPPTAAPVAYQPAPAPAPAPAPLTAISDTPTTITPVAPPVSVAPMAASGGTYTVKKGDTLYGIARAKYGDGKQWKKIAAANPGLSPDKIRVGQRIAIP